MNKYHISFLISLLLLALVFAALKPIEILSRTPSTKQTASDFSNLEVLDGEAAIEQLSELSLDNLAIYRNHVSPHSGSHFRRYHQIVNGHRLYGSAILLVTDADENFSRLSTRSPGNTNKMKINALGLSEAEAISAAIRGVYGRRIQSTSFVISPKAELVIYLSAPLYRVILQGDYDVLGKLRYGYVVSLNGSPEGKIVPEAIKGDMIEVLVDANTGRKISVIDRVSR